MPLNLQINGERRSFEKDLTIQELLHVLAVKVPAFVVEVNRSIVPRGAYTTQLLKDGDCVEIVTFVGGG